MTVKLLPCPFCCGEAIRCGNNEINPRHWIMCRDCHACPGGDVPDQVAAETAWNTRDFSPMTIVAGVISELAAKAAPQVVSRGSEEDLKRQMSEDYGCGAGGLTKDDVRRHIESRTAHPDDIAVDRFAAAMKAKLAKKRDDGRGGWEDKNQCSNEFLSKLLLDHVEKGDPVDVGNLAMMIQQRGESICILTERVAALSQLHAIVDAWEALPGGRQVRNSDVEAWLGKHMGPGIDAIRGFLRRPRPDGILPPAPTPNVLGLPVAAYTVDFTGCDHVSRDVVNIEKIAAAGSKGPTEVVYLYAGQAPASGSRGTADIDQKALAVADDLVRQMIDKGALLAIRDNEGELVPMALDRQFQLKAGWQIAIGTALATSEGSTDA